MKLTFCSADNADYARQWVEQSEILAGKYTVEEKKARIPLMMNVEKIRLAFREPEKVAEFFALESRWLASRQTTSGLGSWFNMSVAGTSGSSFRLP